MVHFIWEEDRSGDYRVWGRWLGTEEEEKQRKDF
jgi:hypothetical protein